MKPTITCCTPYNAPYPSGHHWTHSRHCPDYPSRKVGDETRRRVRVTPKPSTPAPPTAPEPTRTLVGGPDHDGARPEVLERLAPSAAHPACIAAADEGAMPCSRCSWLLEIDNEGARYIDHHLDSGKALR